VPNALEQAGVALHRAPERHGAALAAALEPLADDVCPLLRGGRAAAAALERGAHGAPVRAALAVAAVACARRAVAGRARARRAAAPPPANLPHPLPASV
jgi:hypothetical protein